MSKTTSTQTSVQNEVFSAALSLVSRVPSTSMHPITNYVVVKARGKTMLQVAKTSLDITVIKTVPANNEGEGALAIDAKRLGSFAASLGKGNVGIRLTASTMTLWNAQASAEFKGISDTEFPTLDVAKGNPVIKLAPMHLKAAIQQVSFAAATGDNRPMLMAVYWQIKEELILAAADGLRLSEAKALLTEVSGEPRNVLVPIAAMRILEAALDGNAEVVEVALCESKIVVTSGNTVIHAQLLQEKFVDYQRLIPKVVCQAQMPHEGLVRALKSITIFNEGVDVKLDTERTEIAAVGAEIGAGMGVVAMEAFKGESQTFRAQARLLLQALESLQSSSIILGSAGPGKAILMKPKGENGGVTSLHVVMPYNAPEPPKADEAAPAAVEATTAVG